jgi:hypothetical protein
MLLNNVKQALALLSILQYRAALSRGRAKRLFDLQLPFFFCRKLNALWLV